MLSDHPVHVAGVNYVGELRMLHVHTHGETHIERRTNGLVRGELRSANVFCERPDANRASRTETRAICIQRPRFRGSSSKRPQNTKLPLQLCSRLPSLFLVLDTRRRH